MKFKIYKPGELSNEDYQALPEISGSPLVVIYKSSVYHLKLQREKERKETKAQAEGIATHACLLEHDRFHEEFVRGFDESLYPEAMRTIPDLKAWLKERGIKVASKSNKDDLICAVIEADPEAQILDDLNVNHCLDNEDKTIVKAEVYDNVLAMRETIMADDKIRGMLENAFCEYSLVGKIDGIGVKMRPDIITRNEILINYKTTRDCHPERFGLDCYKMGYMMRAAFEWDVFTAAYGHEPNGYMFLAQEKETFIWKPYYMDKECLEIGRQQYHVALARWQYAIDNNTWSAYGEKPEPIMVPDWAKRLHLSE